MSYLTRSFAVVRTIRTLHPSRTIAAFHNSSLRLAFSESDHGSSSPFIVFRDHQSTPCIAPQFFPPLHAWNSLFATPFPSPPECSTALPSPSRLLKKNSSHL